MTKRILILLCVALVAACSSDKGPKRLCPQTAIVRELERVQDFGHDTPGRENLVAEGLLRGVKGSCHYRDEGGVDVDFAVRMAAARGPRLGGDHVSFPFFVAVADPSKDILSKEMMTAEFRFSGKDKIAEHEETLHVFIPADKDADAAWYQVLIGFQLSEDQLDAARKAANDETAK